MNFLQRNRFNSAVGATGALTFVNDCIADTKTCATFRTPRTRRRKSEHDYGITITPKFGRRAPEYDALGVETASKPSVREPANAVEAGHFYQTLAPGVGPNRPMGPAIAHTLSHKQPLAQVSPASSPKPTVKHLLQASSRTLSINSKSSDQVGFAGSGNVSKSGFVEMPAFSHSSTVKNFSGIQASFV